MSKPMKRFGEKVRALRKRCKMSQQQLADLLHVGRSHIGAIERGEKTPHAAMILHVAEIFGVTPNDLMLDSVELPE